MSLLSRLVGRRLKVGVAFLLVFAGALGLRAADLTTPSARDRQITLTVAALVKQQHLLRHPLDKEISERCLKNFLQTLDPMKIYFYKSDYDEFAKDKDNLADMVQKGDISFAYRVYNTFLARIDERVKMIDQILAAGHDFTVDEELIVDKNATTYAETREEAYDRWRKRIKYDMLLLKAEQADSKTDKSEGKTPIERLTKRYHSFAKRMHQTDPDELLEMYLTSLTMALDPHTTYMSPDSYKNFMIMMGLKLEGIGASLQGADGYTIVKKLIPGGAAEKEGHLKVDDKVMAVGEGDDGPMEDVVDMKLNDVVKKIRGKPGTVVRLQVTSVKDPKPRTIKITRAEIKLTDSEAKGEVFEVGRRADGKPYKLGVINLPSFYMDMEAARRQQDGFKSTTRDVKLILEDFKTKGVDAVAIDLRTNGGGSLTEAIDLTGLFIYDGPVVQVKDANGQIQAYHDPDPEIAWSRPLAVIVSKFSASASEIFAGAIQDYHRGLIIGDKSTHGKGSVQSVLDVGRVLFGNMPNSPNMGELKITQQQFFRPGGDSTQLRGVVSDIELPSLTTHLDVGEADLDYPLPFNQVPTQRYRKFESVNPTIVDGLRKQSAARVAATEKFQKAERNIARYMEQKKKKSVTLNEAKFLKERAEMNADKEEEKTLEKLAENPSGIERDYYLDEVMNIVVDYMKQPSVAKSN